MTGLCKYCEHNRDCRTESLDCEFNCACVTVYDEVRGVLDCEDFEEIDGEG